MLKAAAAGSGGGSAALTIGSTTITGGATAQVLFNLGGVVSSSAGLTYGDTLTNGAAGLKVGTTGTNAGLTIGYSNSSGRAAIYANSQTPGIQNGVLFTDGSDTTVQAPAGTMTVAASSQINLDVGLGSTKFMVNSAGMTVGSKLFVGVTAPTLASGGCTTPGAITANGTAAFTLASVGTGCSGSQPLVFTLPAATTGWLCWARNVSNGASSAPRQSGAVSTTSMTITNYAATTGLAAAWTDADVVVVGCHGY